LGFLSTTSVKTKLVLLVLSVTSLTLGVGATLSLVNEQHDQERELLKDVGVEVRLLATECAIAMAHGDRQQISELFENAVFSSDIEHAVVFSVSGEHLAEFGSSMPDEHYRNLEPEFAGTRRVGDHVVAVYPVTLNGELFGYVHLHTSVDRLERRISKQARLVLLALAALILIALVVATYMQKVISQPLINLSRVAQRVAREGDLSVVISPPTSGDEIGQLHESFREMIAILHEREESQKHIEAKLHQSEEKFRQLFTELNSGFALHEMIYDDQGHACDFRFLDVNPAFERQVHLKHHEIVGKTARELIPEAEAAWIDRFARVAATGNPDKFTYTMAPLERSYHITAFSPRANQFAVIFDDVTDRVNAERETRLFKTMSDNAGYGALYTDMEGNLLYINNAYLRMLGYTKDEVLGKSALNFHPSDIQPAPEYLLSILLEKDSITALRRTHLRKDGSEVPTLMNLVLLRDESGQPEYIASTVIDITELAEAEQQIRAERDLAQKYLDVAATPMVIIGTDQCISIINRAGYNLLGYEEQELIGKNWFDTCLPQNARSFPQEVFEKFMSGELKTAGYFEYPVLTKSGNIRQLGWYRTILHDDRGNITGTLSSGIDLTDRKWAEEVMKTIVEGTSGSVGEDYSRHLVSRLASSFGCRYAMVGKLCGNNNSRIRSLARWVNDDFGPTIEYDLEGTPCREAIEYGLCYYDKDIRKRFPQSQLLREFDANWYMGIRLEDSSGSPIGVIILLGDQPLSDPDMVKSVLRVFALRVTTEIERQRAEAQREALVADLETKNAELERFTYTVSHDLKSPIITIQGFLGLLQEDLSAGNGDRIQQDIGRISNAATKMQRLLEELLRLSRIGRQVNPTENVSLYEVAREAEELLSSQITTAGAHIEISPDLPTVPGDRPRLHEVLQNLLDNALKYRGDTKDLVVRIGVDNRKGQPVLFVEDNGMGIPPEYQHTVFGLFDKLDIHSEGSGVGLALVKRIVELHGGHIWIESEGLGKGSRFCLTLNMGNQQNGRTEYDGRTVTDSIGRG